MKRFFLSGWHTNLPLVTLSHLGVREHIHKSRGPSNMSAGTQPAIAAAAEENSRKWPIYLISEKPLLHPLLPHLFPLFSLHLDTCFGWIFFFFLLWKMLRKVLGPRKTDEEQGTKSEPRMEHGEKEIPGNNLSLTLPLLKTHTRPFSRFGGRKKKEWEGSSLLLYLRGEK